MIAHHKDAFGNARLAGLNDHEVGKMVRVHVGANLQVLSDVLNDDEVWAFSLTSDGTTHFNTSFFDVRIRTCVRGVLFNIHLVCVSFFERHTAVNIFKMICKLLDHLCALWRVKLVSVSTDGENTMTGWFGGFVTLMVKEAVHEVLCVWCFRSTSSSRTQPARSAATHSPRLRTPSRSTSVNRPTCSWRWAANARRTRITGRTSRPNWSGC